MTAGVEGCMTFQELNEAPTGSFHEILVIVAEVAFDDLFREGAITSYKKVVDGVIDFSVTNKSGKEIPFKITLNPGGALDFNSRYPYIKAIGVMDYFDPGRTKEVGVLKIDILRRI